MSKDNIERGPLSFVRVGAKTGLAVSNTACKHQHSLNLIVLLLGPVTKKYEVLYNG